MTTVLAKHIHHVAVTPTVSTNPAYTAGDNVGGIMTFTGLTDIMTSTKGRIVAAKLTDKSKQVATYDIFLFYSSPAGTFTDNAAMAPSTADLALLMPAFQLSSSNQWVFLNNSMHSLAGLNSPAFGVDTTTGKIYVAMSTPSTPTYASIDSLTLTLWFEVD